MIRVFDLGPQPPVRPVKPPVLLDTVELPPGAEGDPRIEPELRRYTEAYRDYLAALDAHQAERVAWERESGGGPIEILTHQHDIVERDPKRYVRKLPEGVQPGPRSGPHRVVHS
jgi:hypothetical protein